MSTRQRLFGYEHAFDHPVVAGIAIAVAAILVLTPLLLAALGRGGRVDAATRANIRARWRSWLVLAPLMLAPVLLGAAWTIAAVCLLSLLCYREFARATGLFRHRLISLIVVLGILLITFAAADHWYGLFVALPALVITIIAAVAILADQPTGYIQRVALAVFAFLFFGVCLGHLGYFANDNEYRPMLVLIIAAVELNDVFAYLCGRTFGRRRLAPNTSPNKTIGGAVGALMLTTALVCGAGALVFRGTPMSSLVHLLGLGLIIGLGGQLGDLMLSSIKRDLGLKDMGATFPGHGGLLDRFDSLILVAPATFHYVRYFLGIGVDNATRIMTAGGAS